MSIESSLTAALDHKTELVDESAPENLLDSNFTWQAALEEAETKDPDISSPTTIEEFEKMCGQYDHKLAQLSAILESN